MKLKIKRGTLLALLEFQAKNDVRYYLNGIAFMAGGKVAATDGHRLALGEHDNKVKETVIVKLHKLSIIQNTCCVKSFIKVYVLSVQVKHENASVKSRKYTNGNIYKAHQTER